MQPLRRPYSLPGRLLLAGAVLTLLLGLGQALRPRPTAPQRPDAPRSRPAARPARFAALPSARDAATDYATTADDGPTTVLTLLGVGPAGPCHLPLLFTF